MRLTVYLPLALPFLLTLAAGHVADRARPRAAVAGLVGAAVLTAAASVWSLVLLVLTLFDDLPAMVAVDARAAWRLPEPVPDWVALAAAVALGWALLRLALDLHRRREAVRRLRQPGPAADGVVVADWAEPLAVAVPGRPGQVLVTTGMLRLLGAAESRAVLAHERSHLAHRHHVATALAGAAAAVNPLLRPVRETVGYLVERWADEDAAAAAGDRELVARAVARAALAASAPPVPALGVHGSVIVRRVQALRRPPPASGRRHLAAATATAAACVVAAAFATADFVTMLDAWLR
jgi:hypothetical protein